MKEILPWVALLERCRGVPTETLRISSDNCINLMFKLRLNDTLMNEMYMVLSYALLERFGEELQLFTPVYSGQESQERKDTMDTKTLLC